MQNKESKFGLRVRAWLMANPQYACAIETKDTRDKDLFYFREWGIEQEQNAEAIMHGKKGVLIRTDGVKGLPDYVYLKNTVYFVTIKYPKGFVFISADAMKWEMENSKRKSLTWERAKDISTITS